MQDKSFSAPIYSFKIAEELSLRGETYARKQRANSSSVATGSAMVRLSLKATQLA